MALPAEIAALSSSETRTRRAALLARMAELVARVEVLEAENAALKACVGRLEVENAALKAENTALRAEMEQPSKTPNNSSMPPSGKRRTPRQRRSRRARSMRGCIDRFTLTRRRGAMCSRITAPIAGRR
jgi:regulator of replication initiation timing